MDPAIVASAFALVAAGWSGWYSRKSMREVEEIRHAHEAAKRLGMSTGVLQLELFLSTRSVVRRLRLYYDDRPDHPYPVRAIRGSAAEERAYHDGGLLIYRLLRPLTVSHMIEQQLYYADLVLEPIMVDFLRFDHAAFAMLTGDRLEQGFNGRERFPGFDMDQCWDADMSWPPQRSSEPKPPLQRVRGSYLRSAAAALVVSEPQRSSGKRCITHDEFLRVWERPDAEESRRIHDALVPLKAVIDRFDPRRNAVFWLRLVGYAYVCMWFNERVRKAAISAYPDLEYTPLELPIADMLETANGSSPETTLESDQGRFLAANTGGYEERFNQIISDSF